MASFIPIDLPVGTVLPQGASSGGTAPQAGASNPPIDTPAPQHAGAGSADATAGVAAPVTLDPAPALQHVFAATDGTQIPLFSSLSPSGQTVVVPLAAAAENALADLTHLHSSINDDWFF